MGGMRHPNHNFHEAPWQLKQAHFNVKFSWKEMFCFSSVYWSETFQHFLIEFFWSFHPDSGEKQMLKYQTLPWDRNYNFWSALKISLYKFSQFYFNSEIFELQFRLKYFQNKEPNALLPWQHCSEEQRLCPLPRWSLPEQEVCCG